MIVKVEAATPVSTRSNLFDSSVVVALISAAGTIFAALITGLISFFVARDSFPIIGTKAGYKRTLRTLYSNLAQLEHRAAQHGPLDVPLKLQNEIDATKQQIAEVEAKLVELESQ